eukprot:1797519-Pyramimonas_sp.AAC.1
MLSRRRVWGTRDSAARGGRLSVRNQTRGKFAARARARQRQLAARNENGKQLAEGQRCADQQLNVSPSHPVD